MKVLMALLDEEALTPPCENKADLLSEDQPALGGAEGTCVLTLFRLAYRKYWVWSFYSSSMSLSVRPIMSFSNLPPTQIP